MIERLVRDGTAVARSDGRTHRLFPVATSAAEGEALREWVTQEGAHSTIEIGLGYGISALFNWTTAYREQTWKDFNQGQARGRFDKNCVLDIMESTFQFHPRPSVYRRPTIPTSTP